MSIPLKEYPNVSRLSYDAVRQQVMSGDILLCSGTGVFSALIQNATDAVWSHVGFILRLDQIGRVMVLESVESIGVRTVPLSHYVRDYKGSGKAYEGRIFVARHTLFETEAANKIDRLSRFAVDLFGYPYDNEEILRIASRIVSSKLGMDHKDFKRDRAFICSEYVEECYRSVGINIPYNKTGFIAPRDFAADEEINAQFEIDL